ncbi:MAG TPA: hypothetical protein PKD92_03305 [Novosphingobium sp.]|nr:hypothetical protein [Novosphingobium sp.]HMP55580.1 hypothetical protein [Novosphingobium sp.]
MSHFTTERALWDITSSQESVMAYMADPETFLARYRLSEAERSLILTKDVKALAAMGTRGDAEALIALTDEEIIRESGNGGLEIKNWIVALGFVEGFRGEVIEYQPVPEWVTGCGFMELAA